MLINISLRMFIATSRGNENSDGQFGQSKNSQEWWLTVRWPEPRSQNWPLRGEITEVNGGSSVATFTGDQQTRFDAPLLYVMICSYFRIKLCHYYSLFNYIKLISLRVGFWEKWQEPSTNLGVNPCCFPLQLVEHQSKTNPLIHLVNPGIKTLGI